MSYNPTIHHRRSIRLKGYDYSQAGMYFVTICVQNHACLFGEIMNGEMILNDVGKIVCDEWIKTAEIRDNVILHEYIVMPNHFHGIIELTQPVGNAGNAGAVGNACAVGNTGVVGNVGALRATPLPTTTPPQPPTPTIPPQPTSPPRHHHASSQPTITRPYSRTDVKNEYMSSISPKCGELATIVRAFKSAVTKHVRALCATPLQPTPQKKLWQRNYWENIIRNEQSYQYIANYIINNPAKWENDRFYTV